MHKLEGRTKGLTVTSACHLHELPIDSLKLHAVIAIGVGHSHGLHMKREIMQGAIDGVEEEKLAVESTHEGVWPLRAGSLRGAAA